MATFLLLSASLASLPPQAASQRRTSRAKNAVPQTGKKAATQATAKVYACPMHPEVIVKSPGKCPKCGMNLMEGEPESGVGYADAEPSPSPQGAAADAGEAALAIPDTIVYDQDGRRLNFYTDLVKGRTVAINFIFTSCTTICPPLTATFRRAQQLLGARAGKDVSLISISVDPVTDTPERLKNYSAKFKAGPGWTFVTGEKAEIDALLKALGVWTADKNDHTPMVLVGNEADRRWTRTYGLAPATSLVKVIEETAGAPAMAAHAEAEKKKMAEASAKYFPNHTLLTQDGKEVRFYDDMLKGKIVLINFLFTTCQGVCSPMTANLAKVQSYLGEHVNREVAMISITVDPVTDTPEKLKEFAGRFKTRPGWFFLTGKKENVDGVLYKLGGYVADKNAHSSVLIIGNEATGEWMKLHAMANPSETAAAVIKLIEKDGKQPEQ
ncbi:MAG: SCO family protein [Rubrivivax sp.]|nr:SCO family protein [Pyrinomonadaceae bacterium]